MGTEVCIKLICRHRERGAATAAIEQVVSLLHEFGREAWAWGSGAVAGINRALTAGEVAQIPASLQPLFALSWKISMASGGLFEPRMAGLVRLWGFDDVARLRTQPPARADVDALLHALRDAPPYDGGAHYGPAPGIGWDFGGIGKGYIVDQALQLLGARGFNHAVIDAGGNLAVRGMHAARAWRVGIRDPRVPAQTPLLASLEVTDEAVITHGNDQRYFDYEGRRYAHILHPQTGMPVQGLQSLTVVHADAALADAAGAALYVAGHGAWPTLARRLGLRQVLAVREDGRLQATAALARRLQLQEGAMLDVFAD